MTENHENTSQTPVEKKKKPKGYLKAAFTGAVVMGGISFAAKAAAGCAAVPGWGGLVLAAVASGLALTGYNMVKDYRAAKPGLDAEVGFTKFVTGQWKHYTKRFAVNSGFSALGALAFVGIGEALESTAIGQSIKGIFCSAAEKCGAFFGFESAPADVAPEPAAGPVTAEPAEMPVPVTAPSPVDLMIQALEECEELTPTGQRIYEGLLAGESWAMESAGVGFLNGTFVLPNVDPETALALIECAAELGNENARIDLAYYQYHGLHGIEVDCEQALETINEIGRSWVGGESLLQSSAMPAIETASAPAPAAEVDLPAQAEAPPTAAPMDEFRIVGACQITAPTEAHCTVNKSTIGPGEGMRFDTASGASYIFGLSADSGVQSADQFQTDKLVRAINLAYSPRL